jgi:hypothetical protein
MSLLFSCFASGLARPGTLAQATVFTDGGNPIDVLAKILMWISVWVDYVF